MFTLRAGSDRESRLLLLTYGAIRVPRRSLIIIAIRLPSESPLQMQSKYLFEPLLINNKGGQCGSLAICQTHLFAEPTNALLSAAFDGADSFYKRTAYR